MADKTLVPVYDFDPPAVPTTDHAEQLLNWHLWKAAEWLALEDAAMVDKQALLPMPEWNQAVIDYFANPERREELYSLTLQRLEAMSGLVDSAVLQLLYKVKDEGIYTLEGWQGVTGWALSKRAGYSPTGGTWYRLGQLVDHVIPWVSTHLPDRDHRAFFDMAYIHRLGVIMPQLVAVIERDAGRGSKRSKQEVVSLLDDAKQRTKQQLAASYTRSRYGPIPAWLYRTSENKFRLVLAVDKDRVQTIINRLGSHIDYRGERKGEPLDV